MTGETLLLWIVIGAISGWLAAAIVGGGLGLLGDIIVGVVGAFIGGWLFRTMGWHAPWGGLAGTIFVAFIGAVILLLIIHLFSFSRRSRRVL